MYVFMIKCWLVMILERRGDGATTDVAMKSTSSQHVPTPIGEHSFIISSQCYLKIVSIVSAYLFCFICYAMCHRYAVIPCWSEVCFFIRCFTVVFYCFHFFVTAGWAPGRERIQVMRCWRRYLSQATCKWFACGQADASATPLSLASLKSRLPWKRGP